MSKFIKAGAIEYRPDFFNHRWIAPRWPMLDPVKELQARQMEIDIGERTLDDLLKEQGKSAASMIERRSAELKAMRQGGVPVYHSMSFLAETTSPPAPAPGKPATPPPPPEDDDDETDNDDE